MALRIYLTIGTLILFVLPILAQEEEKKPLLEDFRGTVSITQNGFSIIPSFALGDPALQFDLKFINKRFSFEPDMRFALEGKPWSFVFWFRYKAIVKEKFSLRVGAHPGLNFRTINIPRNGGFEDILESRRFLAGELAPDYKIGKNTGIRGYYLHGKGFDDGTKKLRYLAFNPYINHLHISKDVYFNISPQLYYLRTDDLQGVYVVAFLRLGIENFPLTISSILNKAIDTEIAPESDFTWNISLDYSF